MIRFLLRIDSKTLYQFDFGDKKEILLGTGKKVDYQVPEFDKTGLLKVRIKRGYVDVSSKNLPDIPSKKIDKANVLIPLDKQERVFVGWSEKNGDYSERFKLPFRGRITLGRKPDNTIEVKDGFVSGHHLTFSCEEGQVHLIDGANGKRSTNGVYVNGKRISKALLHSGDAISIMYITIRLINGELIFENVGNCVTFSQFEGTDTVSQRVAGAKPKYRRSPRIREQLPQEPIVLAKPPAKMGKVGKRGGYAGQMISSGVMVASSMALGAVSPALLAARGAMMVPMMFNIAGNSRENKANAKRASEYEQYRQEKYGAYVSAQKAAINQIGEKQSEILRSEFPGPDADVDTVVEMRRNLWDRRPTDDDFLDVRLGMSYDYLCVEVKAPVDPNGFQMDNDEQEELCKSIIEETRIVDNIPARIHLGQYPVIGMVGRRSSVVVELRNLIIHLCAQHYYDDVRIVGIFDEEEKDLWMPLRWLPHIWNKDRQKRYLAFDKNGAEVISDVFCDILKSQSAEKGSGSGNDTHYLFILGSHLLCEHLQLTTLLLQAAEGEGVTALFAYNLGNMESDRQLSYLPPECGFIVDMDDPIGPKGYDVKELNHAFLFTPDSAVSMYSFERYCRTMFSIEVDGASVEEPLPNGITFLQGMGVNAPKGLEVWERWQKSTGEKTLSAPIARMKGGKDFCLDIVKHGPHGLIAGTTGSGKSELITSWLLSVAVNYHPYDVSFVIIDYKGGGLADTLEGLPHMVGKITNIGSNISRSMTSLTAELKRRQEIFSEVGVNKISDYIRGFREGKYPEPLPRLLLVTDEFAELKAQEPEFLKSLISAARIGRSLGIHLVLACQNPSGIVDDQIRSNSEFQICLKVQNSAASRDVISHPDAAYISISGRAYVRVGSDVIYEQVQSYWSGAPYQGERKISAETENQVRIVELDGNRVKTIGEEKTRFHSDTTELQAVSEYLTAVAKEHNLDKMPCPWLPDLPLNLQLDELQIPGAFDGTEWHKALQWLQIPVGKYDLPERQEQGTLFLDFEEVGHYAIYGAPGSGKTTLLKTILMSLANWYSPEEVSMYIIDFGTWSLNNFAEMPHVGVVALSSQEEKFSALHKILIKTFEDRKLKFSQYGVSSLKAYRETVSDDLPAVILAIDNIIPIFDAYPEYEDLLVTISREGSSYGIYLLYTSNSASGIRFKVTQNIRGIVAMEMTDKGDYSSLVGRVTDPGMVAGMKGRAFLRSDGSPIVFQSALYAKGDDESERVRNLKQSLEEMKEAWKGESVGSIPVIPDVIRQKDMLTKYENRMCIPVGYDFSSIAPAYMDLSRKGSAFICGTDRNISSRFLIQLADMVRSKESDCKLYCIDSSYKGLEYLENAADGYSVATDVEKTEEMIRSVISEMIPRENELKTIKENANSEIDGFSDKFPLLLVLVDDLPQLLDNLTDKSFKQMRGIVKNAIELGAMVLAGGTSEELSDKASLEPITNLIRGSQSAILLSGTPANIPFMDSRLGYDEKNSEPGPGNAWLFDNGDAVKVRLVSEDE